MSDSQIAKLKSKITWFALPFIIFFAAWLVLTITSVQTAVNTVQTESTERAKMEERVWVMLQENNKILNTKADEESNEQAHQLLMISLADISSKIDRCMINYENNTTYLINELNSYDTLFALKDQNIPYTENKEVNPLIEYLDIMSKHGSSN